ncbi:MAG: DUF72 domain-containing protein [Nitrososphaerota archaeon]|nr:DUF72 domain-containing protein [Nitrososphaerota archaeon]
MNNILIGTSGWSYKDWLNVFYTSDKKMFQQYAKFFKTVEIDSSFYKQPTQSFIQTIAKTSPKDFIFSIKVPKTVTHVKLMNLEKGAMKDLKTFLDTLAPLKNANKLGAVLFQLPPKPIEAFKGFEAFLKSLPDSYSFVIEFRDSSWIKEDVFKLLSDNNVGYCIVDEPLLPTMLKVTGEFSYVRFHGRGSRPWYYYDYRLEELKEWKIKLEDLSKNSKRVYVYFNNHFKGYAVKNALQMMRIMENIEKHQEEALNKILNYFAEEGLKRAISRVEKVISSGDYSVETLVSAFLEGGRFERSKELIDKVIIEESSGEIVKAKVKEYAIVINTLKKVLKHGCEDWSKRVSEKQFCKHVAAVFLALNKDKSRKILEDIGKNLKDWAFEINCE